MNRIETPFDIARAPDEVFAFLTDFSQLTWRRQMQQAGVADRTDFRFFLEEVERLRA